MEFVEISDSNVEDFSNFIDEDLAEDLDRSFYGGIGAMEGGEPVGAMVFELLNSESEQDTLSRIRLLEGQSDDVKKGLLEHYAEAVDEYEVTESFYESSDEALAAFLSQNGFSCEEVESPDIIVTSEDIKKVAGLFRALKIPSFIQCVSDISVLQYRTFVKNCLFNGTKGLLEDLAYIPKTWFETDISSCALTDDEVTGVMLLRKVPSGKLYVLLYTGFGPDYQKNLSLLLANTAQKIIETYPEGVKVVIRRHNDQVRNLTGKLFAGAVGAKVFSGRKNH